MEKKKQQKGSTSSSLASQLFGPPKPADVLASIFPPSNGIRTSYSCHKDPPSPSASDNIHKWTTKQAENPGNKDRSSIYHQQGAEPSYLSSSLYYGGQESYSRPNPSYHTSSYSSYPKFKMDDGDDDDDDDPSGATRGNWWQGSLYY